MAVAVGGVGVLLEGGGSVGSAGVVVGTGVVVGEELVVDTIVVGSGAVIAERISVCAQPVTIKEIIAIAKRMVFMNFTTSPPGVNFSISGIPNARIKVGDQHIQKNACRQRDDADNRQNAHYDREILPVKGVPQTAA